MGFGIAKTKNSNEFVESVQSTERSPYKYKKEIPTTEYPPFLNEKVTYDDGIWEFDALDIEFDEDTRIITKYDVEMEIDGKSVTTDIGIQLTQKYTLKGKDSKELFPEHINTTDYKDTHLLRQLKKYIQKNRYRKTVEERIYDYVEIAKVN